MPIKEKKPSEVSMKNTKQQLLDAYNDLLRTIEEKQKNELKAEKKIQIKQKQKVMAKAEAIAAGSVVKKVGSLKAEISSLLSSLTEKLETEVNKYSEIQEAITLKEEELGEIFEINKTAATLAALIETQHRERRQFEEEMRSRQEQLNREIDETRQQWKREKEQYETGRREQQELEAKKRKREKEEFTYDFERQKQQARDQFEDEKKSLLAEQARIESEIKNLRLKTEKDLHDRERLITEREELFQELQNRVNDFPGQLEREVAEAVKETSERMQIEAGYQKQLVEKQFEGEKNVLLAKIESLEKTVTKQNSQIEQLSGQHELAYQKVQDVAVKAIEGASKVGSFSGLQQMLTEKKKPAANE